MTETKRTEPRKQIIRAESWDQLFESPEQETADYLQYLVGVAVAEYEGNGSLKEHRVEPDPDGDIHILERTNQGSYSTYQKLKESRDVIITFNHSGQDPQEFAVTCGVGNVNHQFTRRNTFVPSSEVLRQIGDEEIQKVTGINISALGFYSIGKPAVESWEEIMLDNGYLPQRIGHRIFPHFVLEAQAKLMQAYPHLMSR